MSTELTQFQNAGLPADPSQLKQGLQQAREQAPASAGGVQYLKMNQVGSPHEGLITYGAEATEMQEGSKWAVNWRGLQHGFLLRDGGSVNAEVFNPIFQPLPSDLRQTRGNEQWKQAYKCQMICISGEDAGTIVEYSGDAGGVVKLFKQVILPSLEAQIDTDPDKLYPVLTFEVSSYYSNKQKKEIYEMTGELVEWLGDDDVSKYGGEDPTPSPAEPAAAASPSEPDAEAPPPERPAQRRRRRAAAE